MNPIYKTPIFIIFAVVVLISLVPAIHVWIGVGGAWKGVVPEYIEDSSYYYARVNDIVRGHPLIGNPYFIEHKDEIPPAFFLSDWLASIPFVFGLSFAVGVVFNIILWSIIFTLVLYILFRRFELSEKISAIFSLIAYVQVFWLFVRPVSLQTIFPAYLLFLLAVFIWIKGDDGKKAKWLLLFSTIYSIYVYTYLLHIVIVTYGLFIFYYLYTKNYSSLRDLVKVIGIVLVCLIPFFIVTFSQISHPLYFETLARIGLLETHVPRMELYYYGRWVLLVLILWYFSRAWVKGFKTLENDRMALFFSITGFSLLIAAGSNVISGKELELANHVGRFIIVWFGISLLTYISILYRIKKVDGLMISLIKKLFIGSLVIVGTIGMVRNIPRAFPFFRNSTSSFVAVQSYGGALSWLDNNITEPSVIASSDEFAAYVPIQTRHYILFHPSGALQIISDKELEERYLVSQFLQGGASRTDIERDVKLYGGAGKALKGPTMQEHFDDMYKLYTQNIAPHIVMWLHEFKVEFIVVDLHNSAQVRALDNIPTTELYRDENLAILKLLP